jgi:hypothetical protein
MLYLVTGDDRISQKKYIKDRFEKAGMPSLVFLDATEFSTEEFEQKVFGLGLFGEKYTIVLDGICELSERREYILKHAQHIKEAETVVILLEKKIETEFLKQIENHVTESFTHSLFKEKEDFTLWAAIYARNKKNAWTSFVEQIAYEPAEKIHAGFLGQVKNMYKIKKYGAGSTYKELDIEKESTYMHAKRGAALYSQEEIEELFFVLTEMPLLAHNGETDFKLALEKCILKYI